MSRRPTALILTAALTGALPLGGAALAPAASAAAPTEPFVAEIHYDDAGADTGELVEVQLPPGTTSQGWSVVRYNGSGGAPYGTDALPAVTAPADADAVALLEYPANGLQNGSPDGLALVRPDGSVAELLSYEGTFTAVGGPADGRTSVDVGVAENGEPEGQSLSRVLVDGALVWRGPGPATPGALNPAPTAPPSAGASCEVDAVAIGQVQGDGATTPLDGRSVSVRGTVVGDTPGLGGFYLQDGGDGDEATSDAVFVPSAADVALGDTVAVSGTAGEGFGQTQVVPAGDAGVAVCATDGSLPDPAALALPSSDAQREATEGMLVAPTAPLSVSEVFGLTRFGELTLSAGGVLLQPTEVSRPGPGADAVAADNAARRIMLDDGSTARLDVTDAPYLSPTTPVRVGDVATLAEPVVLGYGFGAWRLEPADGTADGLLVPQDTRPAAPARVGGDVAVASFNVLNYFLTFGPLGRGASDQAGLDAQAAKIVAAVRGLDADVVTLEEIEDTDSTGLTPGNADTAVADLVTRLNAAQGAEVWAYAPFPAELYAVPRDVIRNAIVYRTDSVAPVGPAVADVDEAVWSNAREPIAQTFAPVGPDGAALAGGDTFTVVGNHLKSKGGSGATGDNDPANTSGQGAFNGDRTRQAASVAAFVAALQKSTGDDDVLVLGDLNAYTQEDPVQVLRGAGLTDLGSTKDPGRYSYVFDALSGSLDHALGTASLTSKVTGVDTWLINAQESSAYQYDGDPDLFAPNPYRASDHDPLVLGLDLDAPAPAGPTCRGLAATVVGTDGRDVLRGTDGPDVIVGLGGDDVVDARGGDDVVCGGAGNDVVQGGHGDDRIDGQGGSDVITGGPGDDRISGGAGRDVMAGGGGRDTIDGAVRQYLVG